jgi:hypothetical protein
MPAYLSIIDWPQGMTEDDQARALGEAAGLDQRLCTLAVRRGTPQIVARLEGPAAERAVEHLRAAGATAFATPQDDMRAFKPSRMKRLIPALGSHPPMYACEMWRGEPVPLKTAEIALLVHATLRSSETRTQGRGGGNYAGAGAGFLIGGLPGAAVGAALGGGPTPRNTSTTSRLTEMLDIHMRDGSCLRIDADKFSFDVLGQARGVTDRENMAKLLARLSGESPRAIVDRWFPHFYAPPDVVRAHFTSAGSSSTTRRSEAPAFDFYSAWVAGIYRKLTP